MVIGLDVSCIAIEEEKKDWSPLSARILEILRASIYLPSSLLTPAEAAIGSAIRVITNQSRKVVQLVKHNHSRCFCKAR